MAWYDRLFRRKKVTADIKGEHILGTTVPGGLAKMRQSASSWDQGNLAYLRTGYTDTTSGGIHHLVQETNLLRSNFKFDNDFDIYDAMLKLDPELNGAVRAVALTANNWRIDYKEAKNGKIRNAIKELVENNLDFDDVLINAVRNLMVYGNDVSKLVGRGGQGITGLQSLPIKQITIIDGRGVDGKPFAADESNPIIEASEYVLREQDAFEMRFPTKEIWHLKIDFRSNWHTDNLGRRTYGIWGASRFESLKQPIRAKYNSINNRISIEDTLTKQYITIDASAVEHIQDPQEQKERLEHIIDSVETLLEGLRADQIPILPHYVQMTHVDMKNTIPDNSSFLDMINADISAVMQVPRVAAGQEKGSTFAATYNANMWSFQSIRRLQAVCEESIRELFSAHLTLLGISHKRGDIPPLIFEPLIEEDNMTLMQRASMGYSSGLLTLNQALEIVDLPPEIKSKGGDDRKEAMQPFGETPKNPRQDESKGGGDPKNES